MLNRTLLWSAALTFGLALGAGIAGAQERILRHDESAPGRLDPSKVADYSASVLAYNLYDNLVEAKPGGGVIPSLAESWIVSDDGLNYTFTLRPDVKFHSGNIMKAEDVVFSLERMVALAAGHSRLFKGVAAVADGERTVKFTLPVRNATFLPSLLRLPIVDKATVLANKLPGKHGENGDYGEDFLSKAVAGTGAYKLDAHNPQAETTMSRFDGYFGKFAEKAPTKVLIRYGVQASTVRTLMANNEWEITSQWIPTEIKKALVSSGKVLVGEGGAGFFIMPINTQRAPTDDVHVRRAIAMVLDYKTMRSLVEVVPGQEASRPMHGVIPRGMLGYDESIPPHKQDIQGAKAELAKSKYGRNIPPLEVIWVAEVPLEEKYALLVQQNLQQIGLKVNVVKMPWALLTDRAGKPETTPNITQVFVLAPHPDPDALIGRNHSSNLGTTLKMDWSDDKELDAMLEKARSAPNDAERAKIYRDVQLRMMDQVPDIWAFESYTTFVKQDYVTAPPLEHADQSVGVQGGNWQFRKWSINK